MCTGVINHVAAVSASAWASYRRVRMDNDRTHTNEYAEFSHAEVDELLIDGPGPTSLGGGENHCIIDL